MSTKSGKGARATAIVGIVIILIFAHLPLYGPLNPAHWRRAFDLHYTIYDLSGPSLGLHFGYWWSAWLLGLVLAFIFVLAREKVAAILALTLSIAPVILDLADWVNRLRQNRHNIDLTQLNAPTLAYLLLLLGYLLAYCGILRMVRPVVVVTAPPDAPVAETPATPPDAPKT